MNINYTFAPKANQLEDAIFFEPEPIIDYLSTNRKGTEILKCPAFLDYYKNTYLIKAPIDLTFTVSGSHIDCQNLYPQDYLEKIFLNRHQPENLYSTVSLAWYYMFYSNESVMIEVIPPTWHKNSFQNNINVIGATFDISKWYRPLEFAFEIIDDTQPIVIKRGDPLYYVRFNTLEKVKLVKQETSEKIEELSVMCTGLKTFIPNNSMRKNYSLMHKLINKFKSKKCPFK